MGRLWNHGRWLLAGALLGIGGCVSNQQLLDFTRTEFARAVADVLGRSFQIYVQATA